MCAVRVDPASLLSLRDLDAGRAVDAVLCPLSEPPFCRRTSDGATSLSGDSLCCDVSVEGDVSSRKVGVEFADDSAPVVTDGSVNNGRSGLRSGRGGGNPSPSIKNDDDGSIKGSIGAEDPPSSTEAIFCGTCLFTLKSFTLPEIEKTGISGLGGTGRCLVAVVLVSRLD